MQTHFCCFFRRGVSGRKARRKARGRAGGRLPLFVLLALLAGTSGRSQDLSLPVIPTADVYHFVRYGNTPVNYYTGTASFGIPVYEYKDPDFTVPLSLGYAAEGVKPNVEIGVLGVNWFLEAGGVITREVRGVPDDMRRQMSHVSAAAGNEAEGNLYFGLTGFLDRGEVRDGKISPDWLASLTYDNSDPDTFMMKNKYLSYNKNLEMGAHGEAPVLLYGTPHSYSFEGNGSMVQCVYAVETESDIYHFNFMGHRGSFVIDALGRVRVFDTDGRGEYDVTIENMKVFDEVGAAGKPQTPVSMDVESSAISISTGDDYVFTFRGGDYTRYSLPLHSSKTTYYSAYITSWHLSQITAPNGRTVTFEYEGAPRFFLSTKDHPTEDDAYDSVRDHYVGSIGYAGSTASTVSGPAGQELSLEKSRAVDSYQIVEYLKEVRVEGRPLYRFCYERQSEAGTDNTYRMTGIEVFGPEKRRLKRVDLTYASSGSRSASHLIGIDDDAEGRYQFGYHGNMLPFKNTQAIDHWGYYNGQSDNAPLVPDGNGQTQEGDNRFSETGPRSPNGSYCALGLLRTVTYPTGGTTTFEYEPHDYARRLERKAYGGFLPELYPMESNLVAGGARIRRITDRGEAGEPVVREFVYRESLDPAALSSGNLLVWPRYFLRLTTSALFTTLQTAYEVGHSYTVNAYDRSHIEYAVVYERRGDGSCTRYDYSNYRTNPDLVDPVFSVDKPLSLPVTPPVLVENLFRPLSSRSGERGRLLQKTDYDASGRAVARESRFYSYSDGRQDCVLALPSPSNTVSDFLLFPAAGYMYAVYTGNYQLDSLRRTTFDLGTGDSLTVREAYTYNFRGQRTHVRTRDSQGVVRETETVYPTAEEAADSLYKLLGLPRRVVTRIGTDAPDKVTEVREYRYRPEGTGWRRPLVLDEVKAFRPDVPTDVPGEAETEVAYDRYDPDGRLLQVTARDGLVTSYVWGYGGAYPVARVVGAAYDALPLEGYSSADTLSEQAYLDLGTRLRTALPDALVYSYTYEPQVGPATETDPSGRLTRYRYDGLGRLRAVIDEDGHVKEAYDYHKRYGPADRR